MVQLFGDINFIQPKFYAKNESFWLLLIDKNYAETAQLIDEKVESKEAFSQPKTVLGKKNLNIFVKRLKFVFTQRFFSGNAFFGIQSKMHSIKLIFGSFIFLKF